MITIKQMTIFDFIDKDEKPFVGEKIFITVACNVIRAIVISRSVKGFPKKYFEVRSVKNKETIYVVDWFLTKDAAVEDIRKWTSMKIKFE